MQHLNEFITSNYPAMLQTLRELCAIPAPSHSEQARAEYCRAWLESAGARGVYIDDALNVVFPINCEDSREITVFVAHTDTVFPDTEPMPYFEDEERICCPGVGDDTASVAVLLMLAKYFIENKLQPRRGVMLVCNSCEEGLGNLKGTRKIFEDYEGRISQFISFDSHLSTISDACAGSHRYEVEVLTQGGHSYSCFGRPNAICELSKMVAAIYEIKVPEKVGCRTTYNVGNVSGGTSVNTIAQSAKMLCEYRSNDRECLALMQDKFEQIFKNAATDGVRVNVSKIGDRPCGNIDEATLSPLRRAVGDAVESVIGKSVKFNMSSTDCNIPLSLGIPALCIGVYDGGGAHTREEWMDKKSLIPGLEIAIKVAVLLAEV